MQILICVKDKYELINHLFLDFLFFYFFKFNFVEIFLIWKILIPIQ
jgi:hypothetical protein